MKTDLAQLQDIFIKMAEDGFDIDSKLKWGFYFFDDERNKLLEVYEELKDHDYILEEIEQFDENEWRLYVSKIDILTPEKLHRRNIAFNELAVGCGVELYDGWDVEKLIA
ncbi:MAG TPA: ribonuclease E inhibitor RraB [Mucilaginibacter sp.]|jgi:hypothetical protein|nr:ribonuclease E inhibitor RraB [Mucilaginibacter sp.]